MDYMLDVRLKEEQIMILGCFFFFFGINGKKYWPGVLMVAFIFEFVYP